MEELDNSKMVKRVDSISKMKDLIDSVRLQVDLLDISVKENRDLHQSLNELSTALNPLYEEYNGKQQ